MKHLKKIPPFYFLILIGLLVSCKVSPQPITYGSDGCHFCSMTIVDRQHAAELVTEKGKVFKFDAVECMLNHLKDVDNTTIAMFLVNDYDAPGELVDAAEANYLICDEIPSPMGEYLTAFGTKEGVEKAFKENGGETFTWPELKLRFEVTD
ncbi:nitrous oxide reductase accessory protein NosL [Muriicola sp. Z0-33]|uniref:nitrous oxide reductase accessory protein NosL n=1 Tax=Muriicola sp. Z0-33 TaxID=2816957 RepID=UPI0022375EC6|nr:nitrous oxide reductase accessory protein NosL [Muriicola sp. Z0-33]MCW5517176.1 nitrous oxide reductase accessory protein NosL [Muriicola sp. Z0-33]